MLECGVNNDEGYLEIFAEGTGRIRNGVWIGGQYGDVRPALIGHSTIK